jgi:hypothetical protein
MAIVVELYATGPASAETLWNVVGDPWRLPQWTDVDEVVRVVPDPVVVGTEVVTSVDDRVLRWRVTTVEKGLLEAFTDTDRGRLGIGVRVVPDAAGARVILAGGYEPQNALTRLWVRLIGAPALRRRFDRWTGDALRAAAPTEAP